MVTKGRPLIRRYRHRADNRRPWSAWEHPVRQTYIANMMTREPDARKRPTINVWTARLAGLAIVSLAIVPAWLARERHRENQAFLAKAVRVQAVVADLQAVGSADDRRLVPVYRFQDAEGREHSVRSPVAYRHPPATIGQSVPLLYDPGNPEAFKQPSFVSFWAYITVLLAFAGTLVLFGSVVFARGHRFIHRRH